MTEHVVIVAPNGVAQKVLAEEAARVAEVKARGEVPAACGPAITEAPARGAFRVFEPMDLYPAGEDGFEVKPAGYKGRKAMQTADAFDVMAASAVRKKKPSPFTPGQIAMGRHYRDLLERYESAGVRCSSVEAIRSGGSGQGGEFIDAVLRDREEIERLRRRIGDGFAMQVRRVRPSQRNRRKLISDRQLVDAVCIQDRSLSDVLKVFGWVAEGQRAQGAHIKVLRKALGDALERMAGPVPRSGILASLG